jgi:hypothetical protein
MFARKPLVCCAWLPPAVAAEGLTPAESRDLYVPELAVVDGALCAGPPAGRTGGCCSSRRPSRPR